MAPSLYTAVSLADSWEPRGVTSQGDGAGSLGGALQYGLNTEWLQDWRANCQTNDGLSPGQ